jgi:hypothetical protein
MRIFSVLLMACALQAQSPTGAVEGTVTDPSGAVVARASVTITETATAHAIPVVTNDSGRYSVLNLLPGVYSIRVAAPRFASTEIGNIQLDAGAVVRRDVTLKIGKVEETVMVTASAVAVDTVRQTVDTIITEKQIENIPLFSRNFLDLAQLAPGVVVRDGVNLDPTKTFAYRAVGISGRSGFGTRVEIDGIDVTDPVVGSTSANLSSDAVHEFELTRSSLDISGPMTSSGAVSIISRSGSNEIHGTGFWDYYNQDMGARLGYNTDVAPFHRNRAGVSAGGPFVKDRLFWFVNWERTYQQEQLIYAAPEFPQLNVTQPTDTGIRYAKGRLDWNLAPSIRLFYSFQHDWNLATGGGATSPFQNVNWGNTHTVALDVTRQRFTHSLRFGYVDYNNRIVSEELNVKFPQTPQGIPYLLGVGQFTAGPSNLAPQETLEGMYETSYNGSFFHGRHTLRYGMGVSRVDFASGSGGPLTVQGAFNAGVVAQIKAAGGNVQDPLEYPLATFSTSPAYGYLTLAPARGLPHGGHYDTRISWYAGDSIKASRRLTLNLGVRWEYDTGYFPNDRNVPRDPVLDRWIPGASKFPEMPKNLFSPSFGFAYDPAGLGKTVVRGGFYLAYEGDLGGNYFLDQAAMMPPGISPTAFDPSFVAGPDGKPINVDGKHPNGDYTDLVGQPIKNVIGLIGQLHQAVLAAYKNFPFDATKGPSTFSLTRGQIGPIFPGDQFKMPYSLQFNIGVQRELKPGTVVTADYVDNHGVGLPLMQVDYEGRRDASTFNATAARTQVNRVLAGKSVDEYLAANPSATIGAFGLINDTIWPGATPDFLSANFVAGGFTRYRALQIGLRGSRASLGPLRDASYLAGYALSRSESSSETQNAESIFGPYVRDNRHPNDPHYFGPTNLDHTHEFSLASTFVTPGGFRLSSLWTFLTPRSQIVGIPNISAATAGAQGFFATSLNGSGGPSTPYLNLMPGIDAGQLGRSVKSFEDLNRIIQAFNQNYAGRLTPYGQALVDAGLFTKAQLQRLGAVMPAIPLAPVNNPNPWHNLFTTDLRLERPIPLGRWRERLRVSPHADFINLFNHAPSDVYPVGAGALLGGRFGSLNFDYAHAPAGQQASDLTLQRGRLNPTRKVEIGVRVDF